MKIVNWNYQSQTTVPTVVASVGNAAKRGKANRYRTQKLESFIRIAPFVPVNHAQDRALLRLQQAAAHCRLRTWELQRESR